MLDYRVEDRTRNNIKANIFGVNLDPAPDMKLNDKPIYDSEVCAVHTEVNITLNMHTFATDLGD